MNKKTKLILLLGLGGVAVFFLLRKAQAAATEEAAAKPSVGNIIKALIPKAIKVVKGLLAGGGGAAATTGAAAGGTGIVSGGGIATSGITSGATTVIPSTTSAGVGVGGGAGGAFSLGGLAAFAGIALINLYILLGRPEPQWLQDWKASGGYAAWKTEMYKAPASLLGLAPKTYRGSKAVLPEELGGPGGAGGVISSDQGWKY